MTAQRRGGACLTDRPTQCGQDGVGFSWARYHDRNHRRRQQGGNRQSIGMSGYFFEPLEAAVIELLVTARRIEPYHLDQHRIKEVGDRRVVESQMAILADPRTDDIRRVGSAAILVSQACLQWPLSLLARNQLQAVWLQPDQTEKMLL